MYRSPAVRFVAILVLSFCIVSAPLFSQAVSGTILGTVLDASGAVVAKAPINITNTETGLNRTVETDASASIQRPLFLQGPTR